MEDELTTRASAAVKRALDASKQAKKSLIPGDRVIKTFDAPRAFTTAADRTTIVSDKKRLKALAPITVPVFAFVHRTAKGEVKKASEREFASSAEAMRAAMHEDLGDGERLVVGKGIGTDEELGRVFRELCSVGIAVEKMGMAEAACGAACGACGAPMDETPSPYVPAQGDAGIHKHALIHSLNKTGFDGDHEHLFMLERTRALADGTEVTEGMLLVTDADGAHEHALVGGQETGDVTAAHQHAVRFDAYGVQALRDVFGVEVTSGVLKTAIDGAHVHELQADATAIDGVHQHALMVGEESLMSLTAEGFREVFGVAMRKGTVQHIAKRGWIPKQEDGTFDLSGVLPVLRVPDPAALVDRLTAGEPAAIPSNDGGTPGVMMALVNASELNGAWSLYAVVSTGDGEAVASGDALSEEQVASLGDAGAATAAGMSDFMLLPLEPHAVFDPPLELAGEPGAELDLSSIAEVAARDKTDDRPSDDPSPEPPEDPPPVGKLAKRERPLSRMFVEKDDGEERFIFGVVLVPEEVDAQGDIYSEEEVRKAAHGFMQHFGGRMKIMHQGEYVEAIRVVETYLTKAEETHGEETFPPGTWLMGTKVDKSDAGDAIWADVVSGSYTGYSIGGTALREALA